MGRPKTIEVDRNLILLRIGECVSAIEKSHDSTISYHLREVEKLEAEKASIWTNYNLHHFSNGRAATDSEQKSWQSAIRQMVREGLIEADCDAGGRIKFVRLSASGKEHIAAILAENK